MMYTLYDRMETYHYRDVGESGYPATFGMWRTRWFESSHLDTLEYSSIGQSIRLIRGRLKVRVFLFQQTSAWCNGSIPDSKPVDVGSNPTVGAKTINYETII